MSIAENTKLIITISRLVKKNGVGDLIKAMSFLPEDYYLLVVGEGELEQELKELSSGLNLKERVHFLGGVEYDDLPKYLWSSDVFCRPSLSEGLGNVFLEAMAAGVPVVGTKVGGIPDFLQDGQTGLFCEVGNPKDIAEKIMNIVDDEDLKNTLTKNGSELVSETYSWDLVARKMKHMFEKII